MSQVVLIDYKNKLTMTEDQLERATIIRRHIITADSNITSLKMLAKTEFPSMYDLPQNIYEDQKNVYLEAYKKNIERLELFKQELQTEFERL